MCNIIYIIFNTYNIHTHTCVLYILNIDTYVYSKCNNTNHFLEISCKLAIEQSETVD